MGVRVAHNLVSSNILDYIELSPEYSIVEIAAIPAWHNKSLGQLDMRRKYGLNVMAIKRGNNDVKISPHADDLILENDVLVVVGRKSDIEKLERHI